THTHGPHYDVRTGILRPVPLVSVATPTTPSDDHQPLLCCGRQHRGCVDDLRRPVLWHLERSAWTHTRERVTDGNKAPQDGSCAQTPLWSPERHKSADACCFGMLCQDWSRLYSVTAVLCAWATLAQFVPRRAFTPCNQRLQASVLRSTT